MKKDNKKEDKKPAKKMMPAKKKDCKY